MRTILTRGVERGELPADTDVDLLVDLVLGPFFYRRLLTGATLDQAFADASSTTSCRSSACAAGP